MYWCRKCGKFGLGGESAVLFFFLLLVFVIAPLFFGLIYIGNPRYSYFGSISTAFGAGMGIFMFVLFYTDAKKHPLCDDCMMNEVQAAEEQQEKKSSFEDSILHPSIANMVILKPNEHPLNIWHVKVYLMDKAQEEIGARQRANPKSTTEALFGPSIVVAKYSYESLLIATDFRLIFLREIASGNTYQPAMTIDASKVHGVNGQGGGVLMVAEIEGKGQNVQLTDYCDIQRSTLLKMKRLEPSHFASLLSESVRKALEHMAEEERKSRVQYVLDFSFLKSQLERGGIMIQQIKCPTCGAALQLPSSGSITTCQYCSSTIYAQDVFEKMKGLVGGI